MNVSQDLTASHFIQEAAEKSLQVALTPTTRTHVDTPIGSGSVFLEEVQPGLICELHELKCHNTMEFECAVEPQISCSITLEGSLDGINIDGFGTVENHLNRGVLIGFGKASRWIRNIRAQQYFKTCCVTLKPEFFERFSHNFEDQQLAVLDSFRIGHHVEVLPYSQRLVALGHSAFDHNYTGALATLYQESNTLQFVLEFAQLLREENKLIRQIGRAHFDRLMQARAILDSSLIAPPKTLDLARQVGTNITTLQAHFKLALGTTVFGYVKIQRLNMARVLLIDHHLPVTETALRVGFSSPSAFTAAYKKHFGHPPSLDC